MVDPKKWLFIVGRFLAWPIAHQEEIEEWFLEGPGFGIACVIGVILGGFVGIAYIRSVMGVLLSCVAGAVGVPLLTLVIVRMMVAFYAALILIPILWIVYQILKAVWLVLQISW